MFLVTLAEVLNSVAVGVGNVAEGMFEALAILRRISKRFDHATLMRQQTLFSPAPLLCFFIDFDQVQDHSNER